MTPHGPFYRHLVLWVWAAWALYWLVSAFGNKATRRRQPLGSRLAYIVALATGAALIAWRGAPWAGMLSARLWPRSLALYWIGLAVLVAGLGFSVWARVHLGRNWSGVVTVKEGHELIRSGPYRYVRHPIYTGILTGVLGTCACAATLSAALGLAVITTALLIKLRTEERFMREAFPGEYEKYSEEVPALIPFTKPAGPRRR